MFGCLICGSLEGGHVATTFEHTGYVVGWLLLFKHSLGLSKEGFLKTLCSNCTVMYFEYNHSENYLFFGGGQLATTFEHRLWSSLLHKLDLNPQLLVKLGTLVAHNRNNFFGTGLKPIPNLRIPVTFRSILKQLKPAI